MQAASGPLTPGACRDRLALELLGQPTVEETPATPSSSQAAPSSAPRSSHWKVKLWGAGASPVCLLPHWIPRVIHGGMEADSQEPRQPATTLAGASDNKN